jgi:hypothetical protein
MKILAQSRKVGPDADSSVTAAAMARSATLSTSRYGPSASYKPALSRIREFQFEALFILGYTVLQALFVSSDIRTLVGVTTSPSKLN